jgi:hypothetical protein
MKQRPTRWTPLPIVVVVLIACLAGQALAGLNVNAKASVHVIPHASRSCTKSFPAITACEDIVFTEPSPDVDAFPVFFDLVEYQGFDFGMTWPGLYSAVYTSCSDLTIDGIVFPGDGVSHAWTVCQPSDIAIPGWAWLYDYGLVCVIPHFETGYIMAGDCQGGATADTIPFESTFCAGIGGTAGIDPCAQPPVCQVFPTSLDFGTVVIGDPPETRTFAITNTGGGNLEGTVGESCDHYAITDPAGGGPYSIPSGDSLVVTVEFDPTSGGPQECYVSTGTECAEDVHCTGEAIVPVYVDIRPGECPNDLRPESPFVLPVAILGTASFDVTEIDPSSVELTRQGVAGTASPIGWNQKDVGTPFMGDLCDCHKLGGDGFMDLKFKFQISDVVTALELDAVPGQTVELTVTGTLGGGPLLPVVPTFIGADCVQVLSGHHGVDLPGPGIDILVKPKSSGETVISFSSGSEDHIALEIYDVRGRMVTKLVDEVMGPGVYEETWDRVDDAGHRVPAGVYFARLRSSVDKKTAKVVVAN